MQKVLFVNTPSCFNSYAGTRINAAVQVYPLLSHAILAAVVRREGKKAEVLDLGIIAGWEKALREKIETFRPEAICMTSTTPLFPEVARVSHIIRGIAAKGTMLILGGPHATVLPRESLEHSAFDIVVTGEGENALKALSNGVPRREIPGIYYKNGEICSTEGPNPLVDLDNLPMPAFDLYDLTMYKCPRMLNRLSPMVNYMTSRGCVYQCSFCSKSVFGQRIRYKSPARVIEEIKYLLKLGIREIRVIDDMFTTNINRAKLICELILKHHLKFPWTLSAGLRVDCIDMEFLKIAKSAGLYQVALGFESGDQASLNTIDKGITLAQSLSAMRIVKKAGIESVGFFMLGLPEDTEESLKKTIAFAKKLSPTYAKATITVPFPGTRLFEDYEKRGLIKSKEWHKYNLHKAQDIYRHPKLEIETLTRYYHKFYYSFYLRPGFLIKSFIRTLKDFTMFEYFYYGLQTFFPKFFKSSTNRF